MSQQPSPEAVVKRLEHVESGLVDLRAETIGDKNDDATYSSTLRGKIDQLIKEVGEAKDTIKGWKDIANKGVSTALIAFIVGIVGFVVARLTGS